MIKLKWNVDTGYVTRFSDWEVEIDPEDYIDMDGDELVDALNELVQEEMVRRFNCYMPNLEEVINQILDTAKEEK